MYLHSIDPQHPIKYSKYIIIIGRLALWYNFLLYFGWIAWSGSAFLRVSQNYQFSFNTNAFQCRLPFITSHFHTFRIWFSWSFNTHCHLFLSTSQQYTAVYTYNTSIQIYKCIFQFEAKLAAAQNPVTVNKSVKVPTQTSSTYQREVNATSYKREVESRNQAMNSMTRDQQRITAMTARRQERDMLHAAKLQQQDNNQKRNVVSALNCK